MKPVRRHRRGDAVVPAQAGGGRCARSCCLGHRAVSRGRLLGRPRDKAQSGAARPVPGGLRRRVARIVASVGGRADDRDGAAHGTGACLVRRSLHARLRVATPDWRRGIAPRCSCRVCAARCRFCRAPSSVAPVSSVTPAEGSSHDQFLGNPWLKVEGWRPCRLQWSRDAPGTGRSVDKPPATTT